MSKSLVWKQFKKSIFLAFVVWAVIVVGSIKLYTTSKASESLGLGRVLAEPTLACSADQYRGDRDKPTYTPPLSEVDDLYQASLTSPNLVLNPSMTDRDETKGVTGFIYLPTTEPITHQVLQETDGSYYLNASLNDTPKQPAAGWLHAPVSIEKGSYYYSFEYRGTASGPVILETTDQSGIKAYRSLHNLKATNEWTSVEGHILNLDGKYQSVRISLTLAKKGTSDYRKPSLHKLTDRPLSEAHISVSFDDGWSSVYTNAYPLLEKYSIDSTQFINPLSAKEKLPGYMDFKQIRKMASDGHEIGSHSLKHCSQTALTAEELEDDARQSEKIFASEGFPPALGFAYPFGAYDPVTNASKQNFHSYIRTSDIGLNDGYYDVSNLRSFTVEATTPLEEVQQWIDYSKQHKLWLILVFHNIDGEGSFNVDNTKMENVLKAISASGAKSGTISETLKELKQ